MKYLSVCSGIEAASVAWKPLGWTPEFFSEIEPFPSAVLQHHYPEVPNLGDMNNFLEWPDADVDVLVGGTPCQSFSVAGLRKGLDDPRGNLMLTFLAIARRYRPQWVVWENVPGVLSSKRGRDFGTFLGALGECGYGWSYRVLDAQYVRTSGFPRAVPQRRRRVFVVGYLGDWRRAAAVLFESEGLQGHPAPRREAGKAAPTIPSRSTGGGGLGTDFDCDGGLIAHDVAPTLNAHFGDKMGLENQHINGGCGHFVAHALRGEGFDASEDGTGRGTPLVPLSCTRTPTVLTSWGVRRLTPRECERLQGFPDDWTCVPYRNKPAEKCPDRPRYRSLGNSMAVSVMRFIGERISAVEDISHAD
jgi:DNA (cytosine-5)-methyltransferase 1